MKLHIATDGVELTPEIKAVVDNKFSPKLQKFLKHYPDDSVSATLRLKKRARWGFRVRCDLDIPGQNIYAEETHEQLPSAIIALAKEIEGRLRKKKEKTLKI